LKTEMKRNFISQREVNLWNSFPQRAVEAGSLSMFEVETDRFLISKGIEGYGNKAGEWNSGLSDQIRHGLEFSDLFQPSTAASRNGEFEAQPKLHSLQQDWTIPAPGEAGQSQPRARLENPSSGRGR